PARAARWWAGRAPRAWRGTPDARRSPDRRIRGRRWRWCSFVVLVVVGTEAVVLPSDGEEVHDGGTGILLRMVIAQRLFAFEGFDDLGHYAVAGSGIQHPVEDRGERRVFGVTAEHVGGDHGFAAAVADGNRGARHGGFAEVEPVAGAAGAPLNHDEARLGAAQILDVRSVGPGAPEVRELGFSGSDEHARCAAPLLGNPCCAVHVSTL